ncbi:hypothetical protein [Mesorhizobium mediterraneum]|uniref:hypothetical protein n=1 Tax=Mesorhizobium mediterraneum TaxID=43617 RepID=UPI00177BF261|nr:hypothetical protein [Mesorhizobium mediterraneum]
MSHSSIGYNIAIAIAAFLGILVGYFIYAAGYGADASTFGYWVQQPIRQGVVWWAIAGGLVGAGFRYLTVNR